ncbi:TetR/AcrR family transcriptional regulator [Amycolatopsis sp. H20-H5]|uniref:TetR/AcrR family transcriptional regulator n=1 Tax=Amycolatopsis sp. H20-H5 TaxID=3046309 RepID=UPI002DBBA17C|nr:TetR/AcrR family transcriptional regulator [Amycolatopsis sp. H20-H5]MEC3977672.1 TetR/AcrR family transcriptional regulator [Amycolatopsis sp. H20-H5]
MTMEHSGGGDPDRSLALLWRERGPAAAAPARGRKPTLTLDRIVTAALALADAEGSAAASMHRVAKELGSGTMTLYTYVPAKAELLDLMIDEVLTERALPAPGDPRPDGWRAQVRLYAERTRAMFLRHPWLRQVSMVRPALGPGVMAGQEYLLSTVSGLGLSPRQVVAAASSIDAYVTANAASAAAGQQLEQATGETTDTWWDQRTVFWEKYFDVERHPSIVRVWTDGGYEVSTAEAAAEAYEFGLDRLLDGIDALIGTGRGGGTGKA